jgi:ADP-ribose pyrophosphatase YjhB (NUDIX family)
MPLKPNYCSQCGQSVVPRVVGGRHRAVCPACDHVFYENPLPVAAAVVLNERREVLLVKRKREPHKSRWCLPMGFAEMGETIAAAALRELTEEAGVHGQALRLLDADSFESSHYGDLLIVTFEVQKLSGREQPGDDAEEVHYFPIARHPPLAFSSNEKALRACVAAHQEDWAIQDSFVALHSGEDKAMLSDALVRLIEQRAEEVARLWLTEVRSNPTTPSYGTLDPVQLLERATVAISQFGRWLKGDEAAAEVKAFYQALAEERREQGCREHEVLSSLTLLKKHLWIFAWSQGVWQRPVDVYRVLELSRRMAVFFDQAIYRVARTFDADRPA